MRPGWVVLFDLLTGRSNVCLFSLCSFLLAGLRHLTLIILFQLCHVFFFLFFTVQSWFGSLVGVLAVSCSLSWGHEVWEDVCSNCWANIQSVKNGKLFSAKILIYWINQLLKSDLPTWGQRQKLLLKSTNSWAQQSWFCWNMWAKNKCSSFELRWKTQVITEETTWKRLSLFASASLRITVQVKTNQKLNLSFLIL